LWPEFLPGRHAVLFTIMPATGGPDNTQIAVLDLRTNTQTVLVRGGHHAHYVPSGHLVYGGPGGTLRAVPFDLDRLAVMGIPVPVVEEVAITPYGAVDVVVAANGTLAYVAGGVATEVQRSLVWVDRTGREEPLLAPQRTYVYPRISPDGTRIAISARDQLQDIWVWDIAHATLTRATFDADVNQYPVWTRDGRRLLFGTGIQGAGEVFWQAADGTGSAERLSVGSTDRPADQQPLSISPDGSRVVVRQGISPFDLSLLFLGGERRTEPLTRTPFNELNAEISPDGRWLAYESNESGQREVYVRPFPEVSGGRWQVSTAGGTRPVWARNGQELFYMAVEGDQATLMSVRVAGGTTWSAGAPTKLFVGRYFFADALASIGEGRTYDVSPDGRRFLMIKQPGEYQSGRNIVVVQNFVEELKRLVPTN
jgi:serine/threonine-protein kinase